MNNTNPMLISKISEYIDNPNLLKALYSNYNDFELREYFDFQSDSINNFTLARWLWLLKSFFSLQLILNKKLYLPGIGLFTISPQKYYKEYSFPGTLKKMWEQGGKAWYTKKIIHNNMINKILQNNKLNFEVLDNETFQIKKTENDKFSLFTNLDTKIQYLNNNIKNFIDIPNLEVIHSEKYNWWKEFKDIVENYRSNQDNSFQYYIEDIMSENLWYNTKILEDLIVLIGYVENNKDKFIVK